MASNRNITIQIITWRTYAIVNLILITQNLNNKFSSILLSYENFELRDIIHRFMFLLIIL